MNKVLADLKRLQDLDDLERGDRRALEEDQVRLREAGARLESFETRFEEIRQELEEMKNRHLRLEGEAAGLSAKKDNNEKRQMSVKNNNEYAALQKEAEFLRTRLGEVEDEILELLEKIDRNDLQSADLSLLLAEERLAHEKAVTEIGKAAAGARERLGLSAERRQSLAASLPPAQLKQYEEIAKVRGGRAVSAAADGLCLACRLAFPPQIYNELQRNEKILNCPNCGRIIYWRGHPDFKEEESPS
ncbi:MAG: C4-type zinc ribbon domain-containing protein [Candidatus Adiutrix sp.]|nr:C4-type zinc ribbon domain-containing protein [Candidatus Adiutrix sp.]